MPSEKEMMAVLHRIVELEGKIKAIFEKAATEAAQYQQELQTARAYMLAQTFSFPAPEGTTAVECQGYYIKCKQDIKREVDEPALSTMAATFRAAGIPTIDLIRIKKELAIKPYRKLNPKQRKLFDQALIISYPSPVLTIISND